MNVLNFGSLNIDNVCRVAHFVRPGETLAAKSFERFAGGKGLNQSLALARSGITVCHAGKIGADGLFLKEILQASGVDCRFLQVDETLLTGCAMIQVSDTGENCIVLYGGANQELTAEEICRTLAEFDAGDILLLQNEVNHLAEIVEIAAGRGMRIFLNPAPMGENIFRLDLKRVDTLMVNEIEGAELAGCGSPGDFREVLSLLREKYPKVNILMTLGAEGAVYASSAGGEPVFVPASPVEKVVDTTGAGDTFIGYFLSGIVQGFPVADALKTASRAAAHCIVVKGAANSIPWRGEHPDLQE